MVAVPGIGRVEMPFNAILCPVVELQFDGRTYALRLQAELENFRKRTQRAMEEERRYACLPIMRDLLEDYAVERGLISSSVREETA